MNTNLFDSPVDDVRRDFETNLYGALLVTWAVAPDIEANGSRHILNIHSVPRLDLKPRGVQVSALHVGYVDTALAAGIGAGRRRLTAGPGGAGGRPGALYPQLAAARPPRRHTGNSRATNALSCRAVRHSCISTSSA